MTPKTDSVAVLRECPFCGGEARAFNYVIEGCVECLTCHARITRQHAPRVDTGHPAAIEAWNRRAALSAQGDAKPAAKIELNAFSMQGLTLTEYGRSLNLPDGTKLYTSAPAAGDGRPSDAAIAREFWKRWTSTALHAEAAHELQRLHDDALTHQEPAR